MRHILSLTLTCVLFCGGCAATKSLSDQRAKLTPSDAISQLSGSTAAISALASQLPSTGPTAAGADTVAHIEGYAVWANVALQALGIVVKVAGM